MGIGRVRMKMPVMAHIPQISLPRKVTGVALYPTVVRVIRPHQKESRNDQEPAGLSFLSLSIT